MSKIKQLKKFVKKEWDIEIDIKPEDTLISIAERIVIRSENCSIQDAYKKWIIKENMHLPGWICFIIAEYFSLDHNSVDIYDRIDNLI